MARDDRPGWFQGREAAGFLVSVVFVLLAAVRDVFLGGLFQRVSPLLVAVVAFSLCTLVLLPIALVKSHASLAALLRRPHAVHGERRPTGYVGRLGTMLGNAGINIATFHRGRRARGGEAIALLELDQPVTDDLLKQVARLPGVAQAKSLAFA